MNTNTTELSLFDFAQVTDPIKESSDFSKKYVEFPLSRLRSGSFRRPGKKIEGDLSKLPLYSGDSSMSTGGFEMPKNLRLKNCLYFKGNYYFVIGKHYGAIADVTLVQFCRVEVIENLDKNTTGPVTFFKAGDQKYFANKKRMFTAYAYPSVEKIQKNLRHTYAYGGWFSYEYERKGGYPVMITDKLSDYKESVELGYGQSRLPNYEKYSMSLGKALKLESKIQLRTKIEIQNYLEA